MIAPKKKTRIYTKITHKKEKPIHNKITPKKEKPIRKQLKCLHPECSHRSFDAPSKLQLHNDFKNGIFHFVCDHIDAESGKKCEKAFEVNDQLTAHKKRHSKFRPFVCEHVGCGESFYMNYELQSHWLRMHASEDHPDKIRQLEKNTCEDCGKAFFDSRKLKEHRFTAHTAKDDPEYIAFRAKNNAYKRERYATDEEFRTANLMRGAMHRIFDKAGKEKDSSTELLLGVSYEEAVLHLNDNSRGLKLHDDNIHIDHIRPIASFSLKKCKMEILQCSNINNLQLLPGPENNDKRARFNKKDREAYEPIRKIIAALMPAWLARGECSCGECM